MRRRVVVVVASHHFVVVANIPLTMSLAATTRIVAARTLVRRAPVKEQKRGIIDYLTNYPDRVSFLCLWRSGNPEVQFPIFHLTSSLLQVHEIRKIQVAGGTLQGEKNPTWLKQPNDKMVAAVGFALTAIGLGRAAVGMYRLATGTGKIED